MKILFLIVLAFIITNAKSQELDEIQAAVSGISDALIWAKTLRDVADHNNSRLGQKYALDACLAMYEESKPMLERLLVPSKNGRSFSWGDAIAWLSGALTGNTACLAGLSEMGMSGDTAVAQNLKNLLEKALAVAVKHQGEGGGGVPAPPNPNEGDNLATWEAGKSKADAVVAQDGSGQYKTINEALTAVAGMGSNRPARTIIYVKSGTYNEIVTVNESLSNLMFVGDGIGKTIVTGSQTNNDTDGVTWKTATFLVSAEGFWARDMTFQNTAGPTKGQAVALAMSSEKSVLYRCSFEGYQDTLLAWNFRQFYRDCKILGTVDFVWGSAAAVFQNCDFLVRLPTPGKFNFITAHGRSSTDEKTGFAIMGSRVNPDSDFDPKKNPDVKTYLGRPWQPCARVLFARTDMGDFIDPEGWTYNHAKPDTSCGMFLGEFRDTGKGAETGKRVNWPGIYKHVKTQSEIGDYTVRSFIQGTDWLPATGVPFSADAFQS